ncbi:hypothetical protein HYPSUDRAFT_1013344 [Hypholoma sublateritium FD-334 SS-4]|uniref:Uncharacterized protein n=1 Tax=Hypholoma sublateritium (strain FD-334 SS-4) TaxID=945553 RepID=A0A0D2NEL5_HYPSF|nr:hypothetical protein HYPSUDRAFT_1013344 [Hypholoma sublateritium FD-334 SS-4]
MHSLPRRFVPQRVACLASSACPSAVVQTARKLRSGGGRPLLYRPPSAYPEDANVHRFRVTIACPRCTCSSRGTSAHCARASRVARMTRSACSSAPRPQLPHPPRSRSRPPALNPRLRPAHRLITFSYQHLAAYKRSTQCLPSLFLTPSLFLSSRAARTLTFVPESLPRPAHNKHEGPNVCRLWRPKPRCSAQPGAHAILIKSTPTRIYAAALIPRCSLRPAPRTAPYALRRAPPRPRSARAHSLRGRAGRLHYPRAHEHVTPPARPTRAFSSPRKKDILDHRCFRP